MSHSSRVPFFSTRLKSCVRIPFGCIHLKLWSTIVYARVLLYHVEYVALVFPPLSLSPLFCHMWMPYRRKWPITELPPPKQYRSQLTFVPAHRSHCLFHPCIRFMNRHTTKWRGRGKKDTRRNETAFDSLPLFFFFFFLLRVLLIFEIAVE